MSWRGLTSPPDILDEGALTIYVDGSMYGRPRRGGRGIHFAWVNDAGEEETWDPGLPATMGATNNEMELEAPIDALRLVRRGAVPVDLARFNKIVVRTDSMYVYDNVPNAISTWRKTGWTTKGGSTVLHTPMWKRLISEMKSFHDHHHLMVHFEWSEGKKGRHAKAVDKLAKQSANSPSFGRTRPNLVTRKRSREQLDLGSVRVTGQTTKVRIIQVQYLPPPRRSSRYMYEVVDESDPFHGRVDRAESDLHLQRGSTYVVRMNDQQQNPRISELVEEVLEDLTRYFNALDALGRPSTARQVTDELSRTKVLALTSEAVKRRLDKLAESGQVKVTRGTGPGRRHLYEAGSPPIEVQGDA